MEKAETVDLSVETRPAPPLTLAYVRHVGPFAGNLEIFASLFAKVFAWAGPRGLVRPGILRATVYHDDPDTVPESRLRISVGIVVPEGTVGSEGIDTMEFPAGRFAVGRALIAPHQYPLAWAAMMGRELPRGGFTPDERPCFEMYLNDPSTHPMGLHDVEIWVAVKD